MINLARISSPTFGFYSLKRLSAASEALFGSLSSKSSHLHFALETLREAAVIFGSLTLILYFAKVKPDALSGMCSCYI